MELNECILILKAISDETRLLIFNKLKKEEEVCACKLLELVNCNQSTLSHHLKILVDSGIVNSRKEWKWVHYSINKDKLNELLKFLGE